MAKRKKYDLLPLHQKVLITLADSPLNKNFYWTGGTALAFLYLQHRLSEDIDLFSDAEFNYQQILPLIHSLQKSAQLKKVEEKKIFSRYEFFLHNDKMLRLEFVHYDFPSLKIRKKWKGIYVDSLTDIAANKTMALLDRYSPKDAFDVYFLIHKANFSPKQLLSLMKRKFGITCPLSSFWGRGLAASQMLKNIKPLLLENEKQQTKLLNNIQAYFEKQSASELRNHLLE